MYPDEKTLKLRNDNLTEMLSALDKEYESYQNHLQLVCKHMNQLHAEQEIVKKLIRFRQNDTARES